MTTLEKLFMGLFERKQWVGDQLSQQLQSYEESLACNLALRGLDLPPWLFHDGPQPRSQAPVATDYSNHSELNGKQILTDLLFPSNRVTTPANRNPYFPIPSKATQSFQNSPLTGACFLENHIQNLQADEEVPGTSLENNNEDQHQIKHSMTDIGALSTIQRSRSRQKDIEKRSSVKKAPIDSTTSFRPTDNTNAEILGTELIENPHENQRPHFHLEKDISSIVGAACRVEDGERRKETDVLKSSTSHIINPVLAETMNSVETSAFEPKRLAFSLALTSFDNNLDSVVENQDESRDGSSGSLLNNAVELKISTFDEPGDRPCTVSAKGLPSQNSLGPSSPREAAVAIHAHNSLLPDGVRGGEERNEEIADLVNNSARYIVNTELNESPHCMDNDEVQNSCPLPIKGLQQMTEPSLGVGNDMREVEQTFYARDSYSPICDVTGFNKEAIEVNRFPFISKSGTELDQSPRKRETELGNMIFTQAMEDVGDEALGSSDKRKNSVTSCFHVVSGETSLSGASSGSCRSNQTTPLSIKARKSADTSPKSVRTNPKSQGEGNLLKTDEGIKHLTSGGRYFLQSSAGQENSNPSDLQDRTVAKGVLKNPREVHFHVNVNTWPKRRKMEFSNFSVATSPRPRKRPVHTKIGYFPMEEDESEMSVSVLEEHHRIPSMTSSSADNRKAPVSPIERNIGSPIMDANHFSISPREGELDNTFKYMPEVDGISPPEGDITNSSNYVHENIVGTSLKGDVGSFIDHVSASPELEAFTMGAFSDSEGEARIIPETFPLQRERASLLRQLSSSLCNTPGSCFFRQYDTISNVYKSVPTGHFDFMKNSEESSVPANDRIQLSEGFSIPHQSGPFGYPGIKADLSTSGMSDRVRSPLTTPVENFGCKRPLTPPAQKFSHRKLSETSETENISGKRGGMRSSGKTSLHHDLTCFRIDEDTEENDVPNENDPFDPLDLSAVPEESAFLSVNDSQDLQDDDGPNYQNNTLQEITAVLENMEKGASIHDNFSDGGDVAGKNPKQSAALLNTRELGRKATGSMRSGLATVETIQKGQEKSLGTVSSKPSNIISGITSFVPLVKQKQQPVPKKREVRIPALEAAEAKKRLEEKKRIERELQKAAMKAEREKLNQEKVLKRKQEEEQKKEAEMAVKKRQREEREKKEKERDKEKKRKCTEMDRQIQREEPTKKEPLNRARVAREEKELHHNVIDEKEQLKKGNCGNEDALVRPRETGSSTIIIDDADAVEAVELPRVVEKSYEMSPYKDSDAEDDDLDELEEDKIRRRKFIPSWARKEHLEDYLQSKKYLNPELIFSCKCSFDMTKVLKSHRKRQNI